MHLAAAGTGMLGAVAAGTQACLLRVVHRPY